MSVDVGDLLRLLVNTAEKGANIARVIRSQSELLDLLVEEKAGILKNDRFVQDFKTLADVLVQEIVRHDLSQKVPELRDNIFGEESNKFTNALGHSVSVEICSSQSDTSSLLCSVLDGNKRAAELLAEEAHKTITVDPGQRISQLQDCQIDVTDIGVWIDPIDSTQQFISGIKGKREPTGIVNEGLQCVAILIGVYCKSTGLPVMGVTNQPFHRLDSSTNGWTGNLHWGVSYKDKNVNSITDTPNASNAVVMSSSESKDVQSLFEKKFTLHYTSGAGYKILCVIQGLADTYILSKHSTYKWDTCGPHAILRSMGGGLVNYKSLLDLDVDSCDQLYKSQVHYDKADIPDCKEGERWCNHGGLVAYRSKELLSQLAAIVREN